MHCREPVHFSEKLSSARHFVATLTRPLIGCILMASCCALQAAEDPKITGLLDAAEAAEREDHLIYPASGSAMSLYYDVLFLEPANPHALEGLIRLTEHHLEAAQKALEDGQLIKADSLVSKARMIYPEYPGIATLSRQIEMLENAERTRVTLDWRLVAERSPALSQDLLRLGSLAKKGDCRVTINVSNDAEGRWIYQKMNSAEGQRRIRAEVKIASPAAVEILCFAATEPQV